MRFIGRFLRVGGIIAVMLVLFVAFTYALASALLLDRDLNGDIAAGATPEAADSGAQASETTTAAPAAGAAPVGDARVDTAIAAVSCGRNGGETVPFAVTVNAIAAGSEPLLVAVELATVDGLRLSRTVEAVVTDASVAVTVPVPDSVGREYAGCQVTAVQQGDRVVLTGS